MSNEQKAIVLKLTMKAISTVVFIITEELIAFEPAVYNEHSPELQWNALPILLGVRFTAPS